jgi:hypothetical protein
MAPTDQLRILTGLTNVPDLRGTFQRPKAGAELVDGSLQASQNPTHNHGGVGIVNSQLAKSIPNFASGGDDFVNMSATLPNVTMITNGSTEFRPKCRTVNIFIRIN